jgi:hypothetical protein
LAEGASQKPYARIRTRGSQGPDDSQGRELDMEHERGAFKVNRTRSPLIGITRVNALAGILDSHLILINE